MVGVLKGDASARDCATGGIRVFPGARAAEAALFAEIDRALDVRNGFAPPLRVMVPSRSLRDHLSRALLLHRGVSVLGVSIQSHYALALEALERVGDAPAAAPASAALLARRAIRASPRLEAELGRYSPALPSSSGPSAWEGARASMRDLQDAGFRPAHLDAALECLGARAGVAAEERVADLLRATATMVTSLEEQGAADAALLLERATAALWSRGPSLLPSAGLWIYGVADATGALADWIDALLVGLGGRLLVNQPLDPAGTGEAVSRYSDDFLERLEARGVLRERAATASLAPASPASLRLVCAAAPAAEAAEVAARVRTLLDAGVVPEEIAICARSFEEYRSSLVSALEGWAIPFSASSLGSSGGAVERCAGALARLLREAEALDIDAWVALDPALAADDRTAFHQLGLARLGALCEPDSDAGFAGNPHLVLPVRRDSKRARSLERERFWRARARARAALRAIASWPETATASHYRTRLGELTEALGWRKAGAPYERAELRFDALCASLPKDFPTTAVEWKEWLREAQGRAGGPEPGGSGAGVQVLSVVAARERCFSHLFLLGLGRDVFPRPISDDPLFPEDLRRRLRAVLPDLPFKRRGHDEERHLFASLVGSAHHVTFSRSLCTATGREWPESPLLLRLRLAAPDLRAEPDSLPMRVPVDLAAAAAARDRDTEGLAALLPKVVAARQRETAVLRGAPALAVSANRVAGALRALWRELDRPPWEAAKAPLGPFFGWVGAPEPNAGAPYITAFADLLRCPWQRFLRRELRLAPPPDAGAELPTPHPRAIGGALHRVLERVAEEAFGSEHGELPRDLAARLAVAPALLRWPDAATLDAWALEAAEESARRDGIRSALFPRLLALCLRPYLARARELDEARKPAVYGAELEGMALLPGSGPDTQEIRFRADRVEASASGAVFVEYKSGRCFLPGVRESTRLRALAGELRRGQGIQAPAYLYANGASAARLVFVGPGTAESSRETTLVHSDADALAAFEHSVGGALRALREGLRPPRLLAVKGEGEGSACNDCEMRVACLQGDGAHSTRLRERAAAALDGVDRDALFLLFHGEAPPA